MRAPRSKTRAVITFLYVLTSASQLHQFPREAFGSEGIPELAAFHLASGLASLSTAIATWIGWRWAWLLSLVWGGVTSALVLSLPRLLRMSDEEAAGMPLGVGMICALAIAGAVYLYRSLGRER